MNFKIDENLPIELALLFRECGHECDTVFDEQVEGRPDSIVLANALADDRIIVTLDFYFADIRFNPPAKSPGCVVLHLRSQSKSNVMNVMRRAIDHLKSETIRNRLWIIDETSIRIRGE